MKSVETASTTASTAHANPIVFMETLPWHRMHVRSGQITHRKSRFQPGVTLLELVSSLAISSILVAGLASALNVAYLSTPRRETKSTVALRMSRAIETICNDLRYATSLTQLSDNSITLTVPDRDGTDPAIEVIEYTWNAGPASPLIRTFNGQSTVILPSVEAFNLVPRLRSVPLPTTYSESEEVLLASYTSLLELKGVTIGSTNWHGQTIRPQPAGAAEWKLTQFRFQGSRQNLNSNMTRVDLCRETALLPRELLETVVIPSNALPLIFTPYAVSFSNCPYLPVGQGVSVIFRAHSSGPTINIQCQKSNANPAPHAKVRTITGENGWEVDSGSSMLFEAWGKYKTANPQIQQHFVNALGVSVVLGSSNPMQFHAVVQILNEPELPSP